jgi:peptidoglycan/xylan/chitin deacetylase (PgdA/CDA1 family)
MSARTKTASRATVLGLMLAGLALLLAPGVAHADFSVEPTANGLTITTYTGSLAALEDDGEAFGLVSAWATVDGEFIGYVFGAPTFVNEAFTSAFAGGLDGEGLIVRAATPSPGAPATVVTKGNTSSKVVALTFDAGSDRGYTSQILDTLRDNDVRASWGMTGRWAEDNPDLVQRMADEGHDFINHSYDHSSFTGLSTGADPLTRDQRWEQLDRTEEIILDLTGLSTKPYFRPPYGDYDASVNADVGARGYAYNVMWTVDSRGWMGLSAGEIVVRCLELHEPGAIYIFHVGSASQDGPALQAIIDGLRDLGYDFVTIPEMLP